MPLPWGFLELYDPTGALRATAGRPVFVRSSPSPMPNARPGWILYAGPVRSEHAPIVAAYNARIIAYAFRAPSTWGTGGGSGRAIGSSHVAVPIATELEQAQPWPHRDVRWSWQYEHQLPKPSKLVWGWSGGRPVPVPETVADASGHYNQGGIVV
jgi:hypothetical protein